jgi:hypothetical protein
MSVVEKRGVQITFTKKNLALPRFEPIFSENLNDSQIQIRFQRTTIDSQIPTNRL